MQKNTHNIELSRERNSPVYRPLQRQSKRHVEPKKEYFKHLVNNSNLNIMKQYYPFNTAN